MTDGIHITVVADGTSEDGDVLHVAVCFKPVGGISEDTLKKWPEVIAGQLDALSLNVQRQAEFGSKKAAQKNENFNPAWKLDDLAMTRWETLFKGKFGPILEVLNSDPETASGEEAEPPKRFQVRPEGRAALTEGLAAIKGFELFQNISVRHRLNAAYSAPLEMQKLRQTLGNGLIENPLSLSFGADLLARTVQNDLLGPLVTDKPVGDQVISDDELQVIVNQAIEDKQALEKIKAEDIVATVKQTVHQLEHEHPGDEEKLRRIGWVPADVVRAIALAEVDVALYDQSENQYNTAVWRELLNKGSLTGSVLSDRVNNPALVPSDVAANVIQILRAASPHLGVSPDFDPDPKVASAAAAKSENEAKMTGLHRAMAMDLLARSVELEIWTDRAKNFRKKTQLDLHQTPEYRRLMEIINHPVLARYFGFVVDFTWRPRDGVEPGLMALRVTPEDKEPTSWTIAKLDRDAAPSLAFRPASINEAVSSLPSPEALKDGIVDLSANTDRVTRFHLTAVDGQQSLHAFKTAALGASQEAASGELTSNINGHLPPLRTVGLSLLDQGRAAAAITDQAAAEAAEKLGKAGYLTAENLMIGMRVDFGVHTDDGTDWFCPYEREIEYRFTEKKGAADLTTKRDDARVIERSYGMIAPLNRHRDDESVVAQETLVTWGGGNLALPSRRNHTPEDVYDPTNGRAVLPLAMHITYRAPKTQVDKPTTGRARGYAPLRDRFGYFTAARPVFIHRGGPTLADALTLYDGGMRIGKTPQEALRFGVNEPIEPPEILLRSEKWEPLFQAENLASMPGTQDDAMILRDGVSNLDNDHEFPTGGSQWKANRRVERYLIPPRVSFQAAKIGGVFDRSDEKKPRGIFSRLPCRRVRWSGGFPEATGGGRPGLRDPEQPELKGEADPFHPGEPTEETESALTDRAKKVSRGHVLYNGNNKVDTPYYSDPLAQVCCILPMRMGQPITDKLTVVPYAPGAAGKGPDRRDAILPIILRMEVGEEFGVTEGKTNVYSGVKAFRTVVFTVPKGEEIAICCWSAPESWSDLARHGLWHATAGAFEALGQLNFSAEQEEGLRIISMNTDDGRAAMHNLVTAWPLPGLTGHRVIRAVTALQKPLRAPTFDDRWPAGDGAKLPFVMQDFSTEVADKIAAGDQRDPVVIACEAWSKFVQAPSGYACPDPAPGEPATGKKDWRDCHEKGAHIAWFGGGINLHRPSTDKVVLQARWKEYDDDPARPMPRDKANPLWPFKPCDGKWTSIETTQQLPLNTAALENVPLDLLTGDDGAPACAYLDFGDNRARDVELRPVGTSRFDGLYQDPAGISPPEGKKHDPEPHHFERPDASDPDDIGDTRLLQIPATARPPGLNFEQDPLPLYHEERVDFLLPDIAIGTTWTGRHIIRKAFTRIFLKRPWYQSGVGQKLALLFYQDADFQPFDNKSPKGNANAITLDVLKGKGALRSMISMRGRDPVFSSGSLPNFLTGKDIFSQNKHGPDKLELQKALKLPLGVGEPEHEVAAALFEVHADRKNDYWIADIGIDPSGTYMPFVRLGLAACQMQCLPGLELSAPSTVSAQVPPKRSISVLHSVSAPGRLRLIVDGETFNERNPGQELDEHKHLVSRPWLSLRHLQRQRDPEADPRRGWKTDLTQEAVLVQAEDREAGSTYLWDFEFALLDQIDGLEHAIAIEEFEKVPADSQPIPGEGSANSKAVQVTEEFGRSRDGLSSIVRGSTRTAAIFTLDEVLSARPGSGSDGKT